MALVWNNRGLCFSISVKFVMMLKMILQMSNCAELRDSNLKSPEGEQDDYITEQCLYC